jgi:hypothetical protein
MSTYLFAFDRETTLIFSFCNFIPGTKRSKDIGMAWHGMTQKSIRRKTKTRKKSSKTEHAFLTCRLKSC